MQAGVERRADRVDPLEARALELLPELLVDQLDRLRGALDRRRSPSSAVSRSRSSSTSSSRPTRAAWARSVELAALARDALAVVVELGGEPEVPVALLARAGLRAAGWPRLGLHGQAAAAAEVLGLASSARARRAPADMSVDAMSAPSALGPVVAAGSAMPPGVCDAVDVVGVLAAKSSIYQSLATSSGFES